MYQIYFAYDKTNFESSMGGPHSQLRSANAEMIFFWETYVSASASGSRIPGRYIVKYNKTLVLQSPNTVSDV